MGAVKAGHLLRFVRRGVKGRQPLLGAELLVGNVSAVGGPVVVGAEIQVLVLAGGVHLPQVDDIGVGRHCGKHLVQQGVLVRHGRAGGQVFRVDHAGRRRQQKGHPAGIPLGKLGGEAGVLHQLGGVGRAELLGEHPVVASQQDVPLFHLLQRQRVYAALQVDPQVAESHLVLQVLAKIGRPAAVQQALPRKSRHLRQAAVLQLRDGPLGPEQVQHRKAEQQHKKQDQGRAAAGGSPLFGAVNVFQGAPSSQKLPYSGALLVDATTNATDRIIAAASKTSRTGVCRLARCQIFRGRAVEQKAHSTSSTP